MSALSDTYILDWWIVKQLRAMVLTDLRDFIPQAYFDGEVDRFKLHEGIINSDHFSRELRWGYLAGELGRRLFFESNAIMSARQVSASEVLMNLGMLAGAETAQGATLQLSKKAEELGVSDCNAGEVAEQLGSQQIPILTDNVRAALKQYLLYLTPLEAEPFLPLVVSEDVFPQDALPVVHHYNFYGTIASLQTGANSVVNVVNNLGAEDRSSLLATLQEIKKVLETASDIPDKDRQELLEKTETCASQIAVESPSTNATELLTMLNVLGTTIQSIASAQPAYQALKVALLPLGVVLP